jgi:hypothetical protein
MNDKGLVWTDLIETYEALWGAPIMPSTQEADVGELLELWSSGLAWII